MSKVYEFLKKNGMIYDDLSLNLAKARFKQAVFSKDTVEMINSYHSVAKKDIDLDKVLTIDAGGTNIRFTEFEKGKAVKEKKMPMFGVSEEITADEFFSLLADEIDNFDAEKVGFCFSYPCEILDNKDGRLLHFNKEVKVTGAEGCVIGEELNKRLKKKRTFSILNDTVTAQLSVSADAAVILGTGFNICYTDKNTGYITVTEVGHYQHLEQGTFDRKLNESLNTSDCSAEKMISGAYLALLIQITAGAYFLRDLPCFELSDVSEYINGKGILSDILKPDEREDFLFIVNHILERSAKIIAMFLSVFLEGYGKVSMALEGTTIYNLPGYYEVLEREVKIIPGLDINFIDARNMMEIGCIKSLY